MRRLNVRLRTILWLSPLIILGLLLLFLVFENVRGQIALARYRRVHASRGEVLTINDLLRDRPIGEDGAPELMRAAQALMKGSVIPQHAPPRMKMTASGRAIVCFREPEWVDEKVTNDWEGLALDLEANSETLSRVRDALARPVFDNQLNYEGGPNMLLTHLTKVKTLTYWLGSASQFALHEGKTREATDNLVAQIRLQRALAQDRILISELVRIAVATIARSDTWEAIQAEGWRDEDLARIQTAWEEVSFLEPMVRSLEGECVFASTTFDLCRRSNSETINVLFGMQKFMGTSDSEGPQWKRTLENLPGGDVVRDFINEQVYCRLWRFAWLDQSECHYLEQVGKLIAIARAAEKSKSKAMAQRAVDKFLESLSDPGPYDRLRFPSEFMSGASLALSIKRVMRAETDRSLALAAIAVRRYTLRHGKPPESLAALVPEFLSAVPVDYMDGKPVRYGFNQDGSTVLYSVGDDGTDDGGDATLMPDVGGRRSCWDRKDCVWPAPARAEDALEDHDRKGNR